MKISLGRILSLVTNGDFIVNKYLFIYFFELFMVWYTSRVWSSTEVGFFFFLLQLLKKHGWKEGTGLGVSGQVCSLHSLISLIFCCNLF